MRMILIGLGLGLGLAFALPVAAAPVTAAAPDDEVWFGGTTRALRSASANALTEDNLGGAVLGYAREVVVLGQALALWAETGMTIDTAHGAMFQVLHTRIGVTDLTAGLRVRYQLHRRIAASARLDAGAQRAAIEISGGGALATDTTWGALASAALAIDLLAVAGPRFNFGVRAELGYVRAQARSIKLHSDTGSPALQLPLMDAALGELDLSGATFGVSLVGGF